MRAECYTLDLYCDNEQVRCRRAQFTGQTRGECFAQAREAGWILGKKDQCPRCSGKQPPQGGSSE